LCLSPTFTTQHLGAGGFAVGATKIAGIFFGLVGAVSGVGLSGVGGLVSGIGFLATRWVMVGLLSLA